MRQEVGSHQNRKLTSLLISTYRGFLIWRCRSPPIMIPFNAKQNTPHHSGYKIFVLNILYVLHILD